MLNLYATMVYDAIYKCWALDIEQQQKAQT